MWLSRSHDWVFSFQEWTGAQLSQHDLVGGFNLPF